MTIPPCPMCAKVDTESSITPDGTYSLNSEVMLASWRCPCGTNRAIKFSMISPELRHAAMLAELARDKESEMMGWGG